MKLRRILVPLDGSILAEVALWKALDFAVKDEATLSLVRAAEAFTLPGADVIEAQVRAVGEAEDYLASVRRRLEERGFRRVETHVWYGPPAAAIVEAAAAQGVDLIVMSTHGHSGLGRLILGSVAEKVLRGTATPILIVRDEWAPVDALKGAQPTKETTNV
jgi:nucleotide-binding universal stress UspA family protein